MEAIFVLARDLHQSGNPPNQRFGKGTNVSVQIQFFFEVKKLIKSSSENVVANVFSLNNVCLVCQFTYFMEYISHFLGPACVFILKTNNYLNLHVTSSLVGTFTVYKAV